MNQPFCSCIKTMADQMHNSACQFAGVYLPDEQPAPVANDLPAVWPLVMKDMLDRDQLGRKRYGVPLQPHNGRDALTDAYEEALDLVVYLRQAIWEREAGRGILTIPCDGTT